MVNFFINKETKKAIYLIFTFIIFVSIFAMYGYFQ